MPGFYKKKKTKNKFLLKRKHKPKENKFRLLVFSSGVLTFLYLEMYIFHNSDVELLVTKLPGGEGWGARAGSREPGGLGRSVSEGVHLEGWRGVPPLHRRNRLAKPEKKTKASVPVATNRILYHHRSPNRTVGTGAPAGDPP